MVLLEALLNTAIVLAVLWCTLAIYWSTQPLWRRTLLAALFVLLTLGAMAVVDNPLIALGWTGLMVGVVIAYWVLVPVSIDQTYSPEAAVLASASFDGDEVTVHDVRNFEYRSPTDFDIRHEDRTYALNDVRTVDFIVSYFGSLHAIAHTFLSFGFADGRYLAVSIEARRLQNDKFAPRKAFFKRYELMYVWGDERDLIRLRTNFRGEQLHLYPTVASPSAARRLLVAMLERTNELRERPVFYSALRRNCTTSIVHHLNQIRKEREAFTRRILMTGYSDSYAHEDGLLAIEGDFEEAKQRCLVNDRARAADADPDFSRKIRTHIAGR